MRIPLPFIDRLRLRTRFALMVGVIVCAFCLGLSLLLNAYLKEKTIQETYKRGQIIFALMDSIGAYVGNTLRPKMFSVMKNMPESDVFIAEAMSTTRIRHGIMMYLGEKSSEFRYFRVSQQPRNLDNTADAFHSKMIAHFRSSPLEREWHGITDNEGSPTFFIMVPVYVKSECLKCHSSPEEAPHGLVTIYGSERGFGYHDGDLMGLESISISLAGAMQETNSIAAQVFIIAFCGMIFLFLAIDGTFHRLVGLPLQRMSVRFDSIAKGDSQLAQEIPISRMDEIGQLTRSFNLMAHHLAEAQETLLTNSEVLQSIVDGISDPLALVQRDGSLAVLNNAYQEWIARLSPAVFGHGERIYGDTGEKPGLSEMLETAFSENSPLSSEWTAHDEHCYLMSFYPITDEQGLTNHVVHYVRDITSHKHAENQMLQVEKMAAIGKLSAGVAHEINNPLGIILCYARLLQRELPDSHPAIDDVRVIHRNAEACNKIIEDLLSFSRQGPTRKAPNCLTDTIMAAAGMVEKQFSMEGIVLNLELSRNLPEFAYDAERIRQVYLNLLMNAREAMPKGGTITISSKYHPEDKSVETRISDNGAGIHPDNLDKIFNPFFTTKQPGRGTGLGLSVSFGIIKEHGGDLTVESTLDSGSTFIILLPVDSNDD